EPAPLPQSPCSPRQGVRCISYLVCIGLSGLPLPTPGQSAVENPQSTPHPTTGGADGCPAVSALLQKENKPQKSSHSAHKLPRDSSEGLLSNLLSWSEHGSPDTEDKWAMPLLRVSPPSEVVWREMHNGCMIG